MGARVLLSNVSARYAAACSLMLATVLATRLGAAQQEQEQEAVTTTAAEDLKLTCASAFEETQRLRNASRYLDANLEVLKCSNPDCGAVLSEECGRLHSELQAATPSVVFAARDKRGNELSNVTVRIDQESTAIPLDGKPVVIDPGSHIFSFWAAGHEAHSQQVVILTGEHFRAISVVLDPANAKGSDSGSNLSSSTVEQPSSRPPPVASYVLGGVGLIGLSAAVVLRISGANDFDELSETCKPTCSTSAVDDVRRKYLFSNIALAVGAAASVAAVAIYFVAKPTANASSLRIGSSAEAINAHFTTRF
jgi:hypothetical protein